MCVGALTESLSFTDVDWKVGKSMISACVGRAGSG